MAYTTIQVRGLVTLPTDEPASDYRLKFELRKLDRDSALVVPSELYYSIPSDGNIDVALWPNARGNAGTVYYVYLIPPRQPDPIRPMCTLTVPDVAGPINIWDHVDIGPPPTLSDAEQAEANALTYAGQAASSASAAAQYSAFTEDSLSSLLADTELTYTSGQTRTVQAGDIIRTRLEGYSYKVAASGASDHHISTSNATPVKLYVQPSPEGTLNVLAFGMDNTGSSDNVAAFTKAAAAARAVSFEEKTLIWVEGTYNFTILDIEAMDRLKMHATGTVQIIGTDDTAGDFIFGSGAYNTASPELSVPTRNFIMTGGPWLISPASGEAYKMNICMEHLVDCVMHNLFPSGNVALTPAADARNYISTDAYFQWYMNYCYNNSFYDCYPGNANITDGLIRYNLFMGNDNTNVNLFHRFRAAGDGSASVGSRGVRFAGSRNIIWGDLSAFNGAIDPGPSRACSFYGYTEACLTSIISGVGAGSSENFLADGQFELLTNGVAFDLGVGGGSINTHVRGRVKGISGGTNRVVFSLGSNCYGLDSAGVYATDYDTWETGTQQGTGGVASGRLTAAQLSFPATRQPSTDVNTLDHYAEGSVTITEANITLSAASAEYTQIGNTVFVTFSIVYPTTSDTNVSDLSFSGIPTPLAGQRNGAALGFQVNPNGHEMTLLDTGNARIIDPATSSNRTNAQCSGDQYYGILVYKTT